MNNQDNITIYALYDILVKNFWLILTFTSLMSFGVVLFSLNIVDEYKSEALVKSSESQESSSIGDQYSGLAAIAGISMPSSQGDNLKYASKLIKSRQFFQHLIDKEGNKLVVPLVAGIDYSKASKTVIIDKKIFNVDLNKFDNNIDPEILNYLNLHRLFLKNLYVDHDIKNGFMTIQFKHFSPIFAEYVVNLIIDSANDFAREKSKVDAKNAMNYLQAEHDSTKKSNIKVLINSLIENNLKTYVLSETKPDYLLETVDPAFIPDKKYAPNRALICIIGSFVSFVFICLLVLVRSFIKDNKD